MQRMFGSQLSVIKLPKSGGVRIPIHNVALFFSHHWFYQNITYLHT